MEFSLSIHTVFKTFDVHFKRLFKWDILSTKLFSVPCAVATVKIKVKVIFSFFLSYKNFEFNIFHTIGPIVTK